jgi:anaerobic selenocysteine-containing dehydrogenase
MTAQTLAFTVVHERFQTDTTRYADVVLPATSSLEHSDIYRSYGSYFIQRAAAVIPPVGESRANWDVFAALAAKLGFEEPFFRQSADELIDLLLAEPAPLRDGIDTAGLAAGKGVELRTPNWPPERFVTRSGRLRSTMTGTRSRSRASFPLTKRQVDILSGL